MLLTPHFNKDVNSSDLSTTKYLIDCFLEEQQYIKDAFEGHCMIELMGYRENDLCKSCLDEEELVQYLLCYCPTFKGLCQSLSKNVERRSVGESPEIYQKYEPPKPEERMSIP